MTNRLMLLVASDERRKGGREKAEMWNPEQGDILDFPYPRIGLRERGARK